MSERPQPPNSPHLGLSHVTGLPGSEIRDLTGWEDPGGRQGVEPTSEERGLDDPS